MTQMAVRKQDLEWMLGRAIAREEARLGAELEDRLLDLPVQDIIERTWLLPPPSRFSSPGETQMVFDIDRLDQGRGVELPESSKRALVAIQESPSPAEIADLGFIDAFFAPAFSSTYVQEHSGDSASIYQWMVCSRRIHWAPRGYPGHIEPEPHTNPFFCPPRPGIYRNFNIDLKSYFGLDISKPWRDLRPVMLNIENLLKLTGDVVMGADRPSYPFPGGERLARYWWELAQSGLRELVRQPGILTQDAARLWVTLSILTNYNKMVAYVRKEMEESARSEQFNLTVLTVSLAVFGLVLGLALGPLVVAGFKAASGALTTAEKTEAVKELNSAAKELQVTDPAFAGQVQWSAQYIQQMLNEASRPAGAPPPGQGGVLEAVIGIGLPTLLTVGISLLRR